MKKIGIITELKLDTVNYGNHLQAYALNRYLSRQYPDAKVETILLGKLDRRKYTSLIYQFWIPIREFLAKCKHIILPVKKGMRVVARFQKFSLFAEQYININKTLGRWSELKDSDYDILIVGSDIVWLQRRGFIRRTKFLDFTNNKNVIKMSYAASFGKNYVPSQNVKAIKKCLTDFKAISVREKASVDLLENIGIQGVSHVCDPTLLLEKEDWEKIESAPYFGETEKDKSIMDNFCFAYLLGRDKKQRDRIEQLCKQDGLYLVTIPYINGYEGDGGDRFGNIQVNACSPQEWIWLIHHAQYVFTDSFHGLVFSTIFLKKYIVLKRASSIDLNMRLEDYLSYLGEIDKYVEIEDIQQLSELEWDYEKICKNIDTFVRRSKKYISFVINGLA